MNHLVLTEDEKARARAVARFAAPKERWYRAGHPRENKALENEQSQAVLRGYRCIFTWTEFSVLCRHLSIAVRDGQRVPPQHVAALAAAFGFSGGRITAGGVVEPGDDWAIHIVRDPSSDDGVSVISVVQRIFD